LRKEGVEVHIYEAKSKSSGLMAHGIAPYKITNEEVFAEIDYLEKQLGFVVHYDHVIQNKADIQRLETEYDAIFLGIGLGATSSLHIEGETLENCFGAVEFIEKLREQQAEMSVPQTVVVLGGGNTAMDAASECMRMGAENVFLAYRRSKEEMGAYDFEYELAKSVGAKGLFNVAPKAILGHEKVEGISLAKTQSVEGKLVEIPDSAFIMTCDWVIKATGQAKQTSFLALIDGLEVDAKGRIVLHHGQATNLKYFAGGDAANGGKEVVNAVFEGKQAARSILNAWN
jgi:glutamate synthase (NADPH/NADH) small chain